MTGRRRLLLKMLTLSGGALCTYPAQAKPEVGVDENAILIGQSAAFSGPAAELGLQYSAGARAYFEFVNGKGGLFGRKIVLKARDDRYEAALAAENTRTLIEKDQVFALFGYVGTPTSNAAITQIGHVQIPFFAPMTGASSLREPFNRLIFNVRASYLDETEYLVDRIVRTGMSRLAVFYQNDAYGLSGLTGVESAMRKRGMRALGVATVERNSTDVDDAALRLMQQNPEVILQISAYSSCAALIKKMRALGFRGQFYNVSFVGAKALADVLGDQATGVIVSQVVPFPWSAKNNSLVAEYTRIIQKAGVSPNFSSLEGYIAAKIFVEGLRRAGRDLTREKLILALETINVRSYDLGGFDVQFSSRSHEGSRYVELTVIDKDGKFQN